MKNMVLQKAAQYMNAYHRKKKWKIFLSLIAVVVVFCVTYALILPAITLEKEERVLNCPLSIHQHTETCYDKNGNLTCGQADYIVHVHNEDCKDQSGNLICQLPEVLPHEHTEELLICDAHILHTHTDSCYDESGIRTCNLLELTEHVHGEGCFQIVEEPDDKDEEGLTTSLPETETSIDTELSQNENVEKIENGNEEKVQNETEEKAQNGTEEKVQNETEEKAQNETEEKVQNKTEEKTDSEDNSVIQEDISSSSITVTMTGMPIVLEEDSVASYEKPMLLAAANDDTSQPQSIFTYTQGKDGADAKITVYEADGTLILPDENNNYNVTAQENYLVNLQVTSVEGMDPGTYYCTFPVGVELDETGESHDLFLNKTDGSGGREKVGTWSFNREDRRIYFYMNENIRHFTNVTLNATVGILFEDSNTPLDFDGNITITVHPNTDKQDTEVSKWAQDKTEIENADSNKIYWEVEVKGNQKSNIVGTTIQDTIQDSQTHHYTESDMTNGIEISAHHIDENGENDISHGWIVQYGDPNLTWTETGWTYTMPEQVQCRWHGGKTETVGNDNWIYYLKYTSTVKVDGTGGYVTYKNTISVDGKTAEGRAEAGKPQISAGIIKEGSYDNTKDTTNWTITTTIPGTAVNEKYNYRWYLWDEMKVKDSNDNTIAYIENNLNLPESVTAIINGQEIDVPEKSKATASDDICWDAHWASSSDENGIYDGQEIDFYSRCTCTAENCPVWDEGKCKDKDKYSEGFCRCWCRNDDITIIFHYTTSADAQTKEKSKPDSSIKPVKDYGGQNMNLRNNVSINVKQWNTSKNDWSNVLIDDDSAKVPIPGVFVKTLTEGADRQNNQTAKFTITVNESKKDLSVDNQRVEIKDTMSQTLIFLPASLQVTAEDVNGGKRELELDTDYTVTYDNETHIATITLLPSGLGAYMYTLVYDAAFYIPAGSSETTYTNTAQVEISGEKYSDDIEPMVVQDAIATGENYSVTLEKVDKTDPTKKLSGAVFGLFSGTGTKICNVTTDENGRVQIKTNITEGILFYEHTPYYFEEITAPDGYKLDSTKHYFWFCNQGEQNCRQCSAWENSFEEEEGADAHRLANADSSLNIITISNQEIDYHKLPETGGFGTRLYTFSGILLMMGTLIYVIYRRKKKEI